MNSRTKHNLVMFSWGVAIALILVSMWLTSPRHNFEECKGSDVPRHCVD